MFFISGDQNIFWDALLKLEVMKEKEENVMHFVHSADSFSRSSKKTLDVSREACLPDGNANRWTATMESASFLGSCPLDPTLFQENGVNGKRISKFTGIPLEKVIKDLTISDWYGVSLPGKKYSNQVTLKEVKEGYKKLKKIMKKDLIQVLGKDTRVLDKFEEIWSLFSGGPDLNKSLVTAYQDYIESFSGKNVKISNTVNLFKDDHFSFLNLWINNYEKIADCYNEATQDKGMLSLDKTQKEVPYFILVDGKRRQAFKGDLDSSTVIVPKAVMLFLQLREKGCFLLPEKGSSYCSIAGEFEENIRNAFPNFPELYPVYRVQFNALDNLKDISGTFRVPEYLQSFFGEEVSFKEFSFQWREVVNSAKKEISEVKEKKPFIWAKEKGFISESLIKREEEVREILRERGSSSLELEILKTEHKARSEISYRKQCEKIADLLRVVISLPYWNSRPMYWWTHVVPGWREKIIKNSSIVMEE